MQATHDVNSSVGVTPKLTDVDLPLLLAAAVLFSSTVLGNLDPLPGLFNQVMTVASLVVLCGLVVRRGYNRFLSPRLAALLFLGSGILALHTMLLSASGETKAIAVISLLRVLGIVVPLTLCGYLIARGGGTRSFLLGALLGTTVSVPIILLAPDLVDEHHVAVGRVFMLGAPLSFMVRSTSRALAFTLLCLHILAAFLTGSRGSILAIVFGIAVTAFASVNSLRSLATICTGIAGLVWSYLSGLLEIGFGFLIGIFLGDIDGNFLVRQFRLFDPSALLSDESAESRKSVGWTPALERFSDRPFTGWGIGASSGPINEPWFAPHNVWMEALVSFGVVGLVIAALLVLGGGLLSVRLARIPRYFGLSAGCTAWLFSIQLSGTLALNRSAYILLAMVAGVLVKERYDRVDSEYHVSMNSARRMVLTDV